MEARIEQRPSAREERCDCGKLVAVLTDQGVEILCRGCKRTHRIAWKEEAHSAAATVR